MQKPPIYSNPLSPFIVGKIAVFIDESNLFHSQRTLNWRIDFSKLYWLLKELENSYSKIFIYSSFLRENSKQIKFLDRLVEYGYVVHSKPVKEIGDIKRKGNLDVELALDALRFSDIYQTIILFSGDSDFAYLLDVLKELEKKAIVISTRGHVALELIQRAKFFNLDKLRSLIELERHKATYNSGLGSTTSEIIPK